MPIPVACKCGKKFAAKDELAGRAVKCPGCGNPLRIPDAKSAQGASPAGAKPKSGPAQKTPAQKPQAKKAEAPKKPAKPAASGGGLHDFFDEAGIGPIEKETQPKCPNCQSPLPPNAVFCVNCGTNFQTGKKIKGLAVPVEKQQAAHDGHGAAAEMLLKKAERAIQEAPTTSDSDEGNFWLGAWVSCLAFLVIAAVVFGVWMGISEIINAPEDEEGETVATFAIWNMAALGLLGLGGLLALAGQIMIAIYAFQKDGPLHGVLALLINIYAIVYSVQRREHLDRAIKFLVGGIGVQLTGMVMIVGQGILLMTEGLPTMATFFWLGLALAFWIGWMLAFLAWIWGTVLAFVDAIYQGVLSIIYPFYNAFFCITRKGEQPMPAKLWVASAYCIFGSILLAMIGIVVLLIRAEQFEQNSVRVVSWFVRPIIETLFFSGILYASTGIYNALFAVKKSERIEIPSYMEALKMAFGLELVGIIMVFPTVFVLVLGGLFSGSAAVFIVVFAIVLLLIYWPPHALIVAEMLSPETEVEFRGRIIVGIIFSLIGFLWQLVWLIVFVSLRGVDFFDFRIS